MAAKKSKKSKSPEICAHCGAGECEKYLSYAADDSFVQSFSPFKRQNKHKNVELVNCPDCEQAWILEVYGADNERVDLTAIRGEETLEQFLDWSKTPFNASPAQLEALAKIGGLKGDEQGATSEYIEVPCKVVLTNGWEYEHCLLRFTNVPPNELVNDETTFWITAVDEISPSQDALPYSVRSASASAHISPFLIKSPDSKIFILNWANQFFATETYKGATFAAVEGLDPFSVPPNRLGDTNQVAYIEPIIVYADWVKGLEHQLIPK
jgi:hypothetical protein